MRSMPVSARLLLLVAISISCSREPAPAKSAPASKATQPLRVELLALDAQIAARGTRPFIAGEKALLTLRVEGGVPPYALQILTTQGNPRLASGSLDIEARWSTLEMAVELDLYSEVQSGSYGLGLRVTDAEGASSDARSQPFEVVGRDAPRSTSSDKSLALQVVDVAGRPRASFYQGEAIRIQALLPSPQEVALAIVAEDERAFMPVRRYQPEDVRLDMKVLVPRMARVGHYRVDLATEALNASVPLAIAGREFPAQTQLGIGELAILGGPNLRAPRPGVLLRGEALWIEAIAGGIHERANAKLRLRDRAGKIVSSLDLADVTPADPHPQARSLVSGRFEPQADLLPGRYTLEVELSEGDQVAVLYRELELGDKAVEGFSGQPELLHAESEIDQ